MNVNEYRKLPQTNAGKANFKRKQKDKQTTAPKKEHKDTASKRTTKELGIKVMEYGINYGTDGTRYNHYEVKESDGFVREIKLDNIDITP